MHPYGSFFCGLQRVRPGDPHAHQLSYRRADAARHSTHPSSPTHSRRTPSTALHKAVGVGWGGGGVGGACGEQAPSRRLLLLALEAGVEREGAAQLAQHAPLAGVVVCAAAHLRGQSPGTGRAGCGAVSACGAPCAVWSVCRSSVAVTPPRLRPTPTPRWRPVAGKTASSHLYLTMGR